MLVLRGQTGYCERKNSNKTTRDFRRQYHGEQEIRSLCGNIYPRQQYDVDVEKGTLRERSEVQVSNASHTAISKNGKFLYSIEDEGVAVFRRDENGDLTRINRVSIDGMRGCFLATDVDGKYLYVAGYHDGWCLPQGTWKCCRA